MQYTLSRSNIDFWPLPIIGIPEGIFRFMRKILAMVPGIAVNPSEKELGMPRGNPAK
jgi:hypothetical protein